MLDRLWSLIKKKSNREIISWFGGGIVVIVGSIWTIFIFVQGNDKKQKPQISITQSSPGIAAGRDATFNAPVQIGLDEKKTAQAVADAQKPLAQSIEKLLADVARQKGVEIAPLRAILIKLGEAGVGEENILQRLDEKADELINLRSEISRLRRSAPELASYVQQAEDSIAKGDLDSARGALANGRQAARSLREHSTNYEADFLAQEAKVDHLQLRYLAAADKFAEAAPSSSKS
jgi:hypothetical protein